MSKENLQNLYDEIIEKIKRMDESVSNIDEQIEKLKKDKKGALYAYNKLGLSDENQKKWVDYHVNKFVGASGSFGISDMITKLEESKELITNDRSTLTKLAKIYYAVLNNLEQKPVDAPPEQDPDAPCNLEKPDFSFCDRTSLPETKKTGGKGAFSVGDVIMVNKKIRIALKDGLGMTFSEGSGHPQFGYLGLQGARWDGWGKTHEGSGDSTLDHGVLAALNEKLDDIFSRLGALESNP